MKGDSLSLEEEVTEKQKMKTKTESHQVWSRCRAGWRRGRGRSLPSSERRLYTVWESAWYHTDTSTSENNKVFIFSLDLQKCLMCAVTASELVALNLVFSDHAATEQTLIASLVTLV